MSRTQHAGRGDGLDGENLARARASIGRADSIFARTVPEHPAGASVHVCSAMYRQHDLREHGRAPIPPWHKSRPDDLCRAIRALIPIG